MKTIDFMERNNFGELFWKAVKLYPDKVAIEHGDITLTYAHLEDRTARVAGLLSGLGVGRTDKVLLMFPNDWRFPECLFGPLRLGAVSVPANVKLGVEALTYIAQHSDSTVLIGHVDLGEKINAVRAGAPNLRHVLIVGGEIPGTGSYDRLLESARPEAKMVEVEPDAPALLMCGSAPVPEELMKAIIERFQCEVVETYGLTEGGANVLTPRWGIKKIGSTGLPVPEVEIRVVHMEDSSRDVAPGEVGELWSRSPANALGYYKQPEVTAERFTPDGWLRTGDLVRRDEQGYVYFIGRKDDMINCGGENIYPKEVETILLSHPAVADVCVVAAPHQIKGQAPVAWVVLHQGRDATEDEIKDFFLARGPAYAHPRRVFFVDRLPISGTNKIDRKALEQETRKRLPEGLTTAHV